MTGLRAPLPPHPFLIDIFQIRHFTTVEGVPSSSSTRNTTSLFWRVTFTKWVVADNINTKRSQERVSNREEREREPALASGGTDGGRGRRVLSAGFSGDALTPQRDEGFPPVLS